MSTRAERGTQADAGRGHRQRGRGRTEIRGKGDPIQLDYRLEKDGAAWKIYDVNVLGVWLVENYRNSFAQEIGANGIDGLIAKMAERNKSAAAKS